MVAIHLVAQVAPLAERNKIIDKLELGEFINSLFQFLLVKGYWLIIVAEH